MLDTPTQTDVVAAKQQARAMAKQGQFADAVRLGQSANREAPEAALELELRDWRHRAYYDAAPQPPRADWPPNLPDPWPHLVNTIPEIERGELSTEVMGGALLHHGSLIVRKLLTPEHVEELRGGVNAAFAGKAKGDRAWYAPFETEHDETLPFARGFAPDSSLMTADSPRMLARLTDMLKNSGVLAAVTRYLGETPVLSAHKTRMYCVSPGAENDWHQDGSFLGFGTRTVNLWVSLSDCGVDAPGLDVVPWRINEIVETGTHNSAMKWTVAEAKVAEISAGRQPTTPIFEPGDAMLFDHLCLHRTGLRPTMTQSRYALESWMFAPSTYPDKAPLVL